VGSAFAAELGTMAVSEQTDSLRVLGSDPVDYLVTPRVLACMIAGPILNLMCFCMGARLPCSSHAHSPGCFGNLTISI
jgi:ABC-type transporter Mla maintaining outer membrane lipid asymmetry permease subunit MlaE